MFTSSNLESVFDCILALRAPIQEIVEEYRVK